MAKNLMNKDHKATNKKYRDNYSRMKWKPRRLNRVVRKEMKKGLIYGHFS